MKKGEKSATPLAGMLKRKIKGMKRTISETASRFGAGMSWYIEFQNPLKYLLNHRSNLLKSFAAADPRKEVPHFEHFSLSPSFLVVQCVHVRNFFLAVFM